MFVSCNDKVGLSMCSTSWSLAPRRKVPPSQRYTLQCLCQSLGAATLEEVTARAYTILKNTESLSNHAGIELPNVRGLMSRHWAG